MRTVIVSNVYPVSADKLWQVATDLDDLNEIAGRAISFRGLPNGRLTTGRSIDVTISLLGLLPRRAYHIEVLECDDIRRTLRSSERGAGVDAWLHTMVVSETAEGSVLIDRIEIEAGWLTLAASIWAKFVYRRRHGPRLRILHQKFA